MPGHRVRGALPRLARTSVEDVFAAVGRGEMFSGDVVRGVYPDYKDERKTGPAGVAQPVVNGAGRLIRTKDQTMRLTFPGGGTADGTDAILVPVGDAAALAGAVRRLAADGQLAQRLGDAGREAFEARASEEVLGAQWRSLLERVVAGR